MPHIGRTLAGGGEGPGPGAAPAVLRPPHPGPDPAGRAGRGGVRAHRGPNRVSPALGLPSSLGLVVGVRMGSRRCPIRVRDSRHSGRRTGGLAAADRPRRSAGVPEAAGGQRLPVRAPGGGGGGGACGAEPRRVVAKPQGTANSPSGCLFRYWVDGIRPLVVLRERNKFKFGRNEAGGD